MKVAFKIVLFSIIFLLTSCGDLFTPNVPVIDAPNQIIINFGDPYNISAAANSITATDKQDGDLTSIIEFEGYVNNRLVGEYLVNYYVKDSDNNLTSKKVKFIVEPDKIKPVLSGPISINFDMKSTINLAPSNLNIKAMDNLDGDISNKITYSGSVNNLVPGEYKITYRVVDSFNNSATKDVFIIINKDLTPPVFSGPSRVIIKRGELLNLNPLLHGISAVDKIDGNLTSKITYIGSVNINLVGNYSITYNVEDASGNGASKLVIFEVILPDTTPPILSGPSTVRVKNGDFIFLTPLSQNIRAIDETDGDISFKITYIGFVPSTINGSYNVTYSVSDAAGNRASKIVTFIVYDDSVELTLFNVNNYTKQMVATRTSLFNGSINYNLRLDLASGVNAVSLANVNAEVTFTITYRDRNGRLQTTRETEFAYFSFYSFSNSSSTTVNAWPFSLTLEGLNSSSITAISVSYRFTSAFGKIEP
jgi:hypothetical protein